MKLALLSDLHANRQALNACLEHARQQGITQLAFLGDMVGYGGEPEAVVDQVMECVAAGAWAIQGNHDALAVQPPEQVTHQGAQGAQWMHDHLRDDQRAFLQALPLTYRLDQVLLVHASADQPQQWPYVDQPRMAERCLAAAQQDSPTRHVFCGHVHQQVLYYQGNGRSLMPFTPTSSVPIPVGMHRHWVATIGSVGQPRDGDPRAMYAILDTERWLLQFERVPYDHQAAAQAIRASGGGLPEGYAERLLKGW